MSPGATPAGRRASAIDLPSVGLNVPLVISPSPRAVRTTWCARSTPPLSVSSSPTSCRVRRMRDERRLADEIARAREIDRPGEAGLERRHRLVHVLAVEVHAGFEAQRVARAEARRACTPAAASALPQLRRVRRRQHDLEAVLAGVAGARDEELAPRRRHRRAA